MSEIVVGIGTSHSPLLAIDGSLWAERGQDDLHRKDLHIADGRVVSYDELYHETAGRYQPEATAAHFLQQHAEAQRALDRLADVIAQARPDTLIVIGDDQNELFSRAHSPAVAVFTGDEIVMHPKNEVHPDLPEWHRRANEGYSMDRVNRHQADSRLAGQLVESLIDRHVDVAIASEVTDPYQAGFGHAYGFVAERLVRGAEIAILPIMLNTYYPPNVPRPARCYQIGTLIAEALAALPDPRRVGVVASGGLSHFVVDEELDRGVLRALETKDAAVLGTLPVTALRSGNSEILNWVMAAGALEKLAVTYSTYLPVRRTPTGTGIGLAFSAWQ